MTVLRLLHRPRRRPVSPEIGEIWCAAAELTVLLGERAVLRKVSVQLAAGSVVAVVGPNGAGKSTLLAALAGDLAPTAGSVRLAAEPIAEWSTVELAQRRAVLPQASRLSFPFTVTDVVRMGRAAWSGTAAEDADDEIVAESMAEVGVAHLAGRLFTTLSGGEQARVSLARVLAQRTDVLLLDEPTAALDLDHQERILGVARAAADAGRAVLMVLHDLGQAAAYADRVLLLSDGAVAADGPPEQVFTVEVLSRVYRHPIEILPHPTTGVPIVLPDRRKAPR